jgi:hypothetical protein
MIPLDKHQTNVKKLSSTNPLAFHIFVNDDEKKININDTRWCTKPKANVPSYLPPPSYTAASAAPVSQYGPPTTSNYSPPPPPPPPGYSAPSGSSYGAPAVPTPSPVYYKPVNSNRY